MKCAYCGKEIADTSVFCPECGQSVKNEQNSSVSDRYWNTVAGDDKKRNQTYLNIMSKQRSEQKSRRNKRLAIVIFVLAVIAVAAFVTINITNANKAEMEAVKANLPGRELTCSYSRTETGFWIHYYYYTLKFNSDGTLNYYYLTTIGPAENGERPALKGTYKYTLTRNIVGDYFITFGNETFTMKVSSNNVPSSLSYGK